MKIANISTAKNQLSALLEEVRRGETVVIMDHKRPVDRVECGMEGSELSRLIGDGILSPPAQKADMSAFLNLPRANLVRTVEEDREGR